MKFLALIFAFAGLCLAADVSGKWKADYTTPDGTARTSTFDFKVNGSDVTGKMMSAMGEVEIREGKTTADEITFFVIRNFTGDDVKIRYKGKISGDSIHFNVQVADVAEFDMTAKRIAT